MVAEDMARVERSLRSKVQTGDPRLSEIISGLVIAGGKRVRPLLTLCATYSVQEGGASRPVNERSVTAAVAVELMHMGSLHHDDVIDEAETRRGVPSVNVRWSNTAAVLSGDVLLAMSSSLGASLGAYESQIIADALSAMCVGQLYESYTLFDAQRSENEYLACVEGKTAALMEATCRLGGLEGGASAASQEALASFGRKVGVAFQIIDDVRDIRDDGVGAGSDLAEGVYTLPVILAREVAPSIAGLLADPDDTAALEKARELVMGSGAMEECARRAAEHMSCARGVLSDARGFDGAVLAELLDVAEKVVSLAGAPRMDNNRPVLAPSPVAK